ncbi:trigger factor family protein, partial [Candidatus Daviesbacteria bacterium]|nr:trigger factor family protein [Candidatus Daviesbacteria bacterium]
MDQKLQEWFKIRIVFRTYDMTAALQKLDDGTIKLTITIPAPVVKKTQEEVVSELVKNAKLAGFRKGKAPKKLVEEKLDKQEVQEEVLKKLLPSAYLEAIKQHNLKPIINPKIHVQKVGVGADWIFEALTCEMPEVKLDGYKEAIAKLTAKSKIIVPGKEPFDSAQGKPEIKFEE